MRDAVIRRITSNKTSVDAFADAEREVMTLIRRNIFDSFINTEGYQVCQVLVKSSQVIPPSSLDGWILLCFTVTDDEIARGNRYVAKGIIKAFVPR